MAGETFKTNLNDFDRLTDALPAVPRQRISINRTFPVVLTATWANVNFGTNSPVDTSTFTDGGRYDFVNLKFIANPLPQGAEQLYWVATYAKFTTKQRPVTIERRVIVPRPIAEGGDYLFPFADSSKSFKIATITKIPSFNVAGIPIGEDTALYEHDYLWVDPMPISAALKAYGARIQVRTTETITTAANRPRLTDCYAYIIPQ